MDEGNIELKDDLTAEHGFVSKNILFQFIINPSYSPQMTKEDLATFSMLLTMSTTVTTMEHIIF